MRSAKDSKRFRITDFGFRTLATLCVLVFCSAISHAQNYPDKPNPPRLVNDFAGMLSPSDNQALEDKLDRYNDSTSTQIAIVIINSLEGEEKAQYATELGHKWGIGTKGKDNGVLILVSKTDRQIFIATGRGVEEFLPDAICERIIRERIKPAFKAGSYYQGLNSGTDEMMARLSGNFVNDDKDDNGKNFPYWIILILFFGFFTLIPLLFRNRSGTLGSAGWIIGGLLGGGGGGGGDSDSGGGFGGFGGGDFGGGGAGDSW